MAEPNALTERQREYREVYLQSDHWRETRAAALERAEHRCQVCNTEHHLDVHHRTYERIGFERPADLTVLCRRCHDLFHGARPGYSVVQFEPGKKQKVPKHKRPSAKARKAAKKARGHRKGDLARDIAAMKQRNAARAKGRDAA